MRGALAAEEALHAISSGFCGQIPNNGLKQKNEGNVYWNKN